ncbi:MAG: DUF2809 domain-containing protein [Candidatus Marinimicrobia bacterium]|nr:DUF2809 domain-containing protein [Candidatus Neomarinimicrobiota bacterium]
MSKSQKINLILLLIITLIGFSTKLYSGPASYWVNNSLGGVFYEIFWCLLILLFLPKKSPWKISSSILLITCILEFMQLWHPQFLESIRSYFIGATLLGTSFTWWDFPYYFMGCGVGWLLMIVLQNSKKN